MNVGYAMSWSFLGLESRCLVNVNITDYDLNRMIYTSKSCSIVESYLKKRVKFFPIPRGLVGLFSHQLNTTHTARPCSASSGVLSLLVNVPTHGGMARLSSPGLLVTRWFTHLQTVIYPSTNRTVLNRIVTVEQYC